MDALGGLVGYVEALLNDYPAGAAFNTYAFLGLFLPLTLAGYWAFPHRRWKLLWLTVMSGVFYSLYDVRFVFVLFGAAAIDYWIALRLEPAQGEARRMWLAASITFNLTLLAFFKYAMFAADSARSLLNVLNVPVEIPGFSIVLPAGISFFTFKTMSYTIDVYRGEVPATRSLVKYCAFVGMFPELVAGPIVRYAIMDEQMDAIPARLPSGYVVTGISLFCVGLAKKVLLADTIAMEIDPLWQQTADLTGYQAWKATLGYTLQLYFDFSGYSDMAIGLAAFLGFRFPINFRAPYQALDPSDFWRRWHITLSTFLRDYLYIPLGGNRGTTGQTVRNLLVVMLLGGLWHGAAWTFVAWGAYHGGLLALHRYFGKPWDALPRRVRQGAMFLLVVFGWVLFRAPNLHAAGEVYAALVVPGSWGWAWQPVTVLFGVACLLLVWLARPTADRTFRPTLRWAATMGFLLAASFVFMGSNDSPFLYYQF